MKHLPFRPATLLAAVLGLSLTQPLSAQTTTTDDFTTPSKWTLVTVSSPATALTVANGRMNYTTTNSGSSGAIATWNGPKLPANQDWSLAADAHIDAFAMPSFGQFVDVFLGVARTSDVLNTNVLLEFDRGNWGGGAGYDIGDSITVAGSEVTGILDEYYLTSPDVSLRMDYNATARTLIYYFDANGATGGYSWVSKGTLPLGPTFDSIGLLPTETFTVMLVGSSELQTVASGTAYLSNLRTTVGGTLPAAPSISAHPASQSIASGASATLSVTASGSGLTYQWYQGTSGTTTTPVGTNSSSFTTPALTTTTAYWVRVSNAGGAVNSNTATVSVASAITLAAALDQPTWTFTSSGSLPWTGQVTTTHDGVDAAKSGAITHSQTSEMSTTVTGPGTLTFWWKVSSESGYDYLRFYMDGSEQSGKISGTVDWTQKSYTLTAGNHTLKWAYSKNSSASGGSDCGWVDQVVFVPAAPAPEIAVEQPVGTGLSDGGTLDFGTMPAGSSNLLTFTIRNAGGSDLTGLAITKDGANAEDFSVSYLYPTSLSAGTSTTFTVTFTPAATGSRSAVIHLASNDADENPFDLTVTGTGSVAGIFAYLVADGAATATITRYTGPGGAVSIPGTINGLTVTGLGAPYSPTYGNVFGYDSGVTSVTNPASVTDIHSNAFSGSRMLAAINVDPANPTYRSADGVMFNRSLTTLIKCPQARAGTYTIPNGVTSIGSYAFSQCSGLTSVTIPNGVTSIGSSAFSSCSGLASMTIPNGVTSIGSSAFSSCSGLASMTIPSGITSIGGWTFSRCTSLVGVTIPATVTSIESSAFAYCASLTNVTIPAGVTNIGADAFRSCVSLSALTLPASVTNIGASAFADCINLAAIPIPAGVSQIGSGALFRCSSLAGIVVDPANAGYRSVDGLLLNKAGTTLIQCPGGKQGACAIPEGVTRIEDNAFAHCTGLTNLAIPTSVAVIGDGAFVNCGGLAAITVAPGNPAFFSVDGVLFDAARTTIIRYPQARSGAYALPAGTTGIQEHAFAGCAGLTDISIPSGVASIGEGAFQFCTGLQNCPLPATVTTMGGAAFDGCIRLASITLPVAMTRIEDATFSGCRKLASVAIPAGVLYIGWSAFEGCTSLATITIPAGVTEIGSDAFQFCSSLAEIAIPASMTRMSGSSMYDLLYVYGCTALAAITVDPANLTYSSVAGVLFDKNQTTLIQYPPGKSGAYSIPAGVTSIRTLAFAGCSGLTSITIPASLTKIDSNSGFSCWEEVSAITVDSTNPAYSSMDGVLLDKSQTTLIRCPGGKTGTYTVPASVTHIEPYALSGNRLTAISVEPNHPTFSSNDGVLFDKAGATLLHYPGEKPGAYTIPDGITVGDEAFDGCRGLSVLSIPASVTTIDGGTFWDCSGLAAFTVDPANPAFSSVDGVLFSKDRTRLIRFPGGRWGHYTIPAGVTSIADCSFCDCRLLTSVTIPASGILIGYDSFSGCHQLKTAHFEGNAPVLEYSGGSFWDTPAVTVYYLPGTKGWSAEYDGCPTAPYGSAPSITTHPAGLTITSGASATLNVTATGSGLTYQWYQGTSGTTTTPVGANSPSFNTSALTTTTSYWVRVTSAGSFADSTTATVTVAQSPMTTWLLANGFPAATNLLSDPNGDGVSLLMAYAFNLNPTHNLSGSMPRPVITADRMNFTFYSGNADVTYLVETSTDLRVWSTVGVTLSAADAGGLRTATFLKAGPTRFMRLRPVIKNSVYGPWRAARFSTADLADTAVSGDLADPDRDGIPNLLEFAMDGQPKAPSTNFAPYAGRAAGYLTLTYRQSKSATDIAFMPQATADPANGSWTAAGLVETGRVDHGTYWLVTVRDAVPIATAPRRFMRLTVNR